MMKRKNNNKKGFTLVELIVVLVILAILAAILVPALLGWVDRARQGQDIVNAKALMTAIQAQMTEEYGAGAKDFSNFDDSDDKYKDIFFEKSPEYPGFYEKALSNPGIEEPFLLLFYTKKISKDDIQRYGISELHEAYRVISVVYWSDKSNKPIYYDFVNNSWEEGSPYSDDLIVRGDNIIQDGLLKDTKVRVCIVGGTSKYADWVNNDSTRTKNITNINDMILKTMNYTGTKNKLKNANIKIE